MRDLRPLTFARDVARYRLTRATAADTATLVALNDDASAWLTARGVRQWPAGGYNAETVAHALGAGHELYLALRDGEPVGKFSLQWEDADLWGQRPPDAGYLHGCACGARLRAWARRCSIGLALASRRLGAVGCASTACVATNDALRAYYERQGFGLRGVANHGWSALYERPAAGDVATSAYSAEH